MATGAHPGGPIFGERLVARRHPKRARAAHERIGPLRVARWFGGGLGIVILFVVGLVLGAAIHLGTPRARRFVVEAANAALSGSFRGRVHVDRLGGLGVFGLSGADATVFDPRGRAVLEVRGFRLRAATLSAAWSALFARGRPLSVDVGDVSVDDVAASLDADADGHLALLDALEPAHPSAPPNPNARGLRITVRHAAVHRLTARRLAPQSPLIDVTLEDAAGSFVSAPRLLVADLAGANFVARRAAGGLDVSGTLRGHFDEPGSFDDAVGRFDWLGALGSSSVRLTASIDHQAVDAHLDVPSFAPGDVRVLLPSATASRPAEIHAGVHGTLPRLAVRLQAALGPSTFHAGGDVTLAPEKAAHLVIDARDVDAHEFAASTPVTSLGLHGDLAARGRADGAYTGDAALRFLGGRFGSFGVPAASIRAGVSAGAAGGLRANVDMTVEEPSVPTRVTATVARDGSGTTARFDVESSSTDLSHVPELAGILHGRARVSAHGSVDLRRSRLDADVHAEAQGIERGRDRVGSATVNVRATGSMTDPSLDAAVHAADVSAGGVRLVRLDATAVGPAQSPRVGLLVRGGGGLPDVDAGAHLTLASGVMLDSVRATLARAGEHALVTARRLAIAHGAIRGEDVHVEGLGSPATITFTEAPGVLDVRGSSAGLDLGRIGRVAGLEQKLQRGTFAFDANLNLRPYDARGHLRLDLGQANVAGMTGVNLLTDVSLDGRRVRGRLHAQASGVVTLDVDAPDVTLGGAGPLSLAGWRRMWGNVSFSGRGDLGRLEAVVPPEEFPFAEARGEVTIKGRLARDDVRDPTPDLDLAVVTDGLVLTPKVSEVRDIDGVYVMPPPPWHLAGIDFDMDSKLDGDKGGLEMQTQLRDRKGELARVHVAVDRLPVGDVLGGNGRFATDLRATPFQLRVDVPERGLSGLPEELRQRFLTGRASATLTASGTMMKPVVHAAAQIRQSHLLGTTRSLPLEFTLNADYDGAHGQARLEAHSGDRQLLGFDGQLDGAVADFLAQGGPHPWRASARAHLAGFPIDAIAFLDDKVVTGQLSGDVSIEGLHDDARADVALNVDSLGVGRVRYRSAAVRARADGRTLDASVRVDQDDHGFALLTAHATAGWGARLGPVLDGTVPLGFVVSAKQFEIGGLQPFVDKSLDEIRGRLDADARGQLDPRSRRATLDGSLALSQGRFEATAGGGEFHDVSAKVTFTREGVVTLEKLSASGMSGRIEAAGSARIAGSKLEGARLAVVIPADAPFPVSAGGVEIGSVDGRIDVSEMPSSAGAVLDVRVPHMRVALPEASPAKVQALGPIPNVRIGAHRGHPLRFVLIPIDGAPKSESSQGAPGSGLDLRTRIDDVQVVRGTQLKVDLTGGVDVRTGGATPQVTGQIRLRRGGLLSVQGRDFRIESGTVSFVGGDPSDPQVIVKAGWTAPDGTVVYANFVGPLKTGKVTLTSTPPLSQQEIVELLVFGSADGKQMLSPTANPTNSAIGTVGGEAAQPLNHMLNQLGLGAVTAKIDTSQSATPRPEVAVQIARDLSVQIAVVLGQPPPGVNPDRTLLTLDWRFLSKWSLSSTVGDAGTTIFDLLWQKRY